MKDWVHTTMEGRSNSRNPLGRDATFDLLSNARRRRLLGVLRESESVDLRTAARRIAAAERAVPVCDIDPDESRSVYVALYQTHVPRLADCDVVRFDGDEGTVSLVDSAATRWLFDVVGEEVGPRWHRYYAAAASLGVGLVVAVGLVGATDAAWGVVGGLLGAVTAGIAAADAAHDRFGGGLFGPLARL